MVGGQQGFQAHDRVQAKSCELQRQEVQCKGTSDDGTYDVKGVGSTSFQLQRGNVFHIEDILYVPGLKKNLISVAVLESKWYTVAFSIGKTLMWASNESISSMMVIGVQEGGLYKVSGQVIQALAHEMINPCQLCTKGLDT